MAVQDRSSQFPTFTRAAASASAAVRQEVTSRYVGLWSAATTLFALLHTGITVGASFWRGGATAPDLDAEAAVGQVIAATAAFGLLLAVALVLVAHGRAVAGFLAALTTGASIALMAGVLARVSPMVPAGSGAGGAAPPLDTPTWWNDAIAVVVALLAVSTVDLARRVGGTYPDTPAPAEPVLVEVAAIAVVAVPAVALLGSDLASEHAGAVQSFLLLAITLVVALLAARAAAASGTGTAVALTLGTVLVHVLLYAAFDRAGGVPGGWGVGTGGPQLYATSASAAVLVLAPAAGRLAGAAWARLRRDRVPPGVAA